MSALCTSKIELSLSCVALLDLDLFSKSDPFCVVYAKEPWQSAFYEIGRTETIDDCLSPQWATRFVLDYNFETVQRIRFEVWDADIGESKEFLGAHETTLAEMVSFSASGKYRRPLVELDGSKPHKDRGQICIVSEELIACKQTIELHLGVENLSPSFFGLMAPCPFLTIYRSNEGATPFSVVKRTEASIGATDWKLKMKVTDLCNGDYDRTLKFEVSKWKRNGNHRLVGLYTTTLRELAQLSTLNSTGDVKISKPRFRLREGTVSRPATLVINSVTITEEPSFLDYIKSGTALHFALAIDFTGSNGNPSEHSSLHYLDPSGQRPNAYELALRSIGEIIAEYDTTGMYPAFGFGAKLEPNAPTSHRFALNRNESHPYCANISEILVHYRKALTTVTLHGPTNFCPVITETASIARRHQDGKHYFVLLIITDGLITDMYQTTQAIIDASSLPLSLIIVGVGNADFSSMEHLDSDDRLLSVEGRTAARDIVQFVPLNRFLSPSVSTVHSQANLAKEVLAEVPDQIVGYMKSRGFKPVPAISANS